MLEKSWKDKVQDFDDRRNLVVPGNYSETIDYAVEQFIEIANESIKKQGYFAVALSGGHTPKILYQALAAPENRNRIDWSRVLLFWSDERNVSQDHKDSNYHMAMEAGLKTLPLKPEHIFRMKAESNLDENALEYEKLIHNQIPKKKFDLVLLGMGEDGHIASLFPMTPGLSVHHRLVTSNFIPQKDSWRMTLTFDCINAAQHIFLYVLGKEKQATIARVLTGPYQPDLLPAQKIGTPENKALWILDEDSRGDNKNIEDEHKNF